MSSAFDKCEEIRLARVEWAKKNGEAAIEEAGIKVVFAEIFNHQTGSNSVRENLARVHPKYMEQVGKAVTCRTTANVALASADCLEKQWETWRTKEATNRAEMQLR